MAKKQIQRRHVIHPPEHRPPQRHSQRRTIWSKLKPLLAVFITALTVFTAGGYVLFLRDAGETSGPNAAAASSSSPTPMSTAGAVYQTVSMPAYVQGAQMTEAYQFAVDRPDVLDYVPCYCGCGQHSGYRNNRNCFIKSGQTKDNIVFDEHGANCDMCIQIAVDAKRMTTEGRSVTEIRQLVDSKYGGTGQPTDTPWPQA